MQECYNKRLNLLVHGIEDSPWETREQTKDKLNQFFIEGLKLDTKKHSFVDLHRLPQRPVTTDGVKKARPIIFKLSNACLFYLCPNFCPTWDRCVIYGQRCGLERSGMESRYLI